MKYCLTILLVITTSAIAVEKQNQADKDTHDRLIFVEDKDEYMSYLKKLDNENSKSNSPARQRLVVDLSNISIPDSPATFTQAWHNPPICQDITGSCWSFSSTSFFESEVFRTTGRRVKLSEMYSVYWEYVEKARQYIRQRGDSAFGRGSQPNAALRIWKLYGAVPAEAYEGKKVQGKFYKDTVMFSELKKLLKKCKTENYWKEKTLLNQVKDILNHHMGKPPATIDNNGSSISPQEYLQDVLRLKLEDYVDIMSFEAQPYFKLGEYKVWDNWWHGNSYLNLPLDDFLKVVRQATQKGYTLAIGGDTSEPGYRPHCNAAVIPSFDIPADAINDAARQLRFTRGETSDDHAIHLVGYTSFKGANWYLIKDSEAKARNGKYKGYMFYREDYIKLKTMTLMVHKDALNGLNLQPRSGEK